MVGAHSTLPGFIRWWGSSAALMRRMVSSPWGPSSSRSSARLPSPTPCSPVQVPPAASARLGDGDVSRDVPGGPKAARAPAPPPAQALGEVVDALGLVCVLGAEDEDAVEVAVAHVSHHGPCGDEDERGHRGGEVVEVEAALTGEAGVPQVPLGLHHDAGQAGDGHADVGGVALGGTWGRRRVRGCTGTLWGGGRGAAAPHLAAGPQGQGGEPGAVACGPELLALLLRPCPGRDGAAVQPHQLLCGSGRWCRGGWSHGSPRLCTHSPRDQVWVLRDCPSAWHGPSVL